MADPVITNKEVVMAFLRGRISASDASSQLGITLDQFETIKVDFLDEIQSRNLEAEHKTQSIQNERRKIYANVIIALGTVIFGTLGVAYINSEIQDARIQMEAEKMRAEIKIQKATADSAREQAEMKYLGNFLEFALSEDANKRLRLAEYFANLTQSTELKANWITYLSKLQIKLDEYRIAQQQLAKSIKSGESENIDKFSMKVSNLRNIVTKLNSNCLTSEDPKDTRYVSLLGVHEKYAVAEADGEMNANRSVAGPWEKFQLITNSDDTVSFCTFHGTYVVAEKNGRLRSDRREAGPWERFVMTDKDGKVSFKTAHGKYVVSNESGAMHADGDEIVDEAWFTVE